MHCLLKYQKLDVNESEIKYECNESYQLHLTICRQECGAHSWLSPQAWPNAIYDGLVIPLLLDNNTQTNYNSILFS